MEHAKLILIFHEVLIQGSMNKAGQALGMSASAISQHIQNLEKHYGIKLLNRNTRTLSPTEAGRKLWEYAQQLNALLHECDGMMADLQDVPKGNVTIALPSGYVSLPQIQALITCIHDTYPNIRLTLKSSDVLNNLWQDGIDIAIRTSLPDELSDDMIARKLATWKMTICASPAYLAKNPITKKSDLLTAHWLNFNSQILANLFTALELPSHAPAKHTDCTVADSRILAKAGFGLAVFLQMESQSLIERGELVEVLPELAKPTRTLYAVTAGRSDVASVSAVLDKIKQVFCV